MAFRLQCPTGGQCDIGANVTVTQDRHRLLDYVPFDQPPVLGGADASVAPMLCPGSGRLTLHGAGGADIHTTAWYCPQLAETLISPQAICADNINPFDSFDIVCRDPLSPSIIFYGPADAQVHVPLIYARGLYYFADVAVARTVSSAPVSPLLASELWHQRLGHPGATQLSKLPHCSTGIPTNVHRYVHRFHSCSTCDHARRRRNTKGPTDPVAALLPCSRFHVDFGFMRATDASYNAKSARTNKSRSDPRIVASVDGYTSYMLMACAVSRYTWVFLTKTKQVPLDAFTAVLDRNGLKTGHRAIRVDQGGELWRSASFRQAVHTAGYVLEPTGADSPWMNGKVERLNGTFGTMVRALLYSAGLPPQFWSFALTHAVYLKNRLWHSAIGRTPFEAHTSRSPDLSHLRVFGSRVRARRPGHAPAKLDDHVSDGIFLGYQGSSATIVYYDVRTGVVKNGGNFVFDEAHFHSQQRPPGPAILYQLGMPDTPSVPAPTATRPKLLLLPASYPPMPCRKPRDVSGAARLPLPLSELYVPPSTAAAARLTTDLAPSVEAVMSLELTGDPFGPSFHHTVAIKGNHPTLGFDLRIDPDRGRPFVATCVAGTPAHQIPRWRSRLRLAYLLAVNDRLVSTPDDFRAAVARLRATSAGTCTLTFTFDAVHNVLSESGLPQLYFDQLRHIRQTVRDLQPAATAHRAQSDAPKLTRRRLRGDPDWPAWQLAEYKQLDQYEAQGMFGEPCVPPPDAAVFNWVWVYKVKENEGGRKKARAVCDGSTRGGKVRVFGHTYAATPDLTDFRIFIALCALEGHTIFGADVSNAFAEAPASTQRYFMRVDDQFHDWWHARGRPDIPRGHAIPVLKNLQGHPEAPRQWHRHVQDILVRHGFTPTTHAPCLYRAKVDGQPVLFLRQVDDFAIGTDNPSIYKRICDDIDDELLEPMKRQGVLRHYNGIDIDQHSTHITIHCTQYVQKILDAKHWGAMKEVTRLPIPADNSFVKTLDRAVPPDTDVAREALARRNFDYRQAVGELIWAMITVRIDINFPTIKLSQFSANPAAEHYLAVKNIYRYLAATKTRGLTYWRPAPVPSLPRAPPPPPLTDTTRQPVHDLSVFADVLRWDSLYGYVDSDWAMDIRHRRSVSGIVFILAGAAVAWKTRVQPTVSLSTSEAEFLAASDAGRMALYLRSVLDELGVPQRFATLLFEDNRGARMMANAGQPTRQSRHIDIRHYAVLDWVERDLLTLEDVSSHHNCSDTLTKQTGTTLFHEHLDVLMGRRPPYYVTTGAAT